MNNLENVRQSYDSQNKQKQLLQNPYLDGKDGRYGRQKSQTAESRLALRINSPATTPNLSQLVISGNESLVLYNYTGKES